MEKKETKVKKENFICIQGWMISELHLKGNDLLVYAIIYGFSQDGSSYFSGGLQYLADWANGTKRGVQKNIDNLLEKGLIMRIQAETGNGVPAVQFAICPQALPWNAKPEQVPEEEKVKSCHENIPVAPEKKEDETVEQSSMGYGTEFHGGIEQSSTGYRTEFHGGIELSSTNNIYNNKYNNINYNKASNEAKEMTRADQIRDIEQRWNRLAQEIGLRKICKLTSSSKRYGAVNARISQYGYKEVASAIDSIRNSTFLQGSNDRGWRIDFDWLFKPNNFPKVLEGKYADDKGAVNHDDYSSGSGSVNRADQSAQGRKYNPADFFGDAWRA